MDYVKNILFVILYFTLLSCGGSIEKVEDYSLYDLTSPDPSNLELITVDGNTLSLSKASGLYVRDQGAASVVLSGTENSTNEIIQVDIPDKKITSFVTIIPERYAECFGISFLIRFFTRSYNFWSVGLFLEDIYNNII